MRRQGFHWEEIQGCRSELAAGIFPVNTDPTMAVDLILQLKVKHSEGLKLWLGLASQLSSNYKKQTAEEGQMHYEKKLEQYSKSLDDFSIFHNLAITRPVHSHTNSNDERTQESTARMWHQKRLIKQSRKALESAETENLLKRVNFPLSLLDKPGALHVSLTSELRMEGRGRKSAEMVTKHKVNGKVNDAIMCVAPLILRFKRQKFESEVENEGCCKSLVGEEAASCLQKIRLKAKQSNDATLWPGLASELSSNDKQQIDEDNQMFCEKLEQYSKSVDDSQIFHSHSSTRPMHLQTNSYDERTQEPAPPMGRQKRPVKQTRKALEAQEAEELLKKRKLCPLSLLDKHGGLNVSLTSELGVEGRGRKSAADMATQCKREHKVKGKENKAPVTSLISRFKRQKHESEVGNKSCFSSLVGSEAASCLPKTMIKVEQSKDAELCLGFDSELLSTDKMCDQLLETAKQQASQTPQDEGNQNCLAHSHTKSTGGDKNKMLENHVPEVGLTENYCIMEENWHISHVRCHRKCCVWCAAQTGPNFRLTRSTLATGVKPDEVPS